MLNIKDEKKFIEVPSTKAASTQSTSNTNVAAVVIGSGVLVMAVALFSYWKRNTNTMSEHLLLFSHDKYNTYV
jgi:hypothetical protein